METNNSSGNTSIFIFMFILLVIIIVFIIIALILSGGGKSDSKLAPFTLMYGRYPNAVDHKPILTEFPFLNRDTPSNDNSSDVWWKYPSFGVSNYTQVTNNLKHIYNPDIGNCTPLNMCGTFYHDHNPTKTNVVDLNFKPVPWNAGARVGYFRTPDNGLPFINEEEPIN
jgi:hypothetical protein